MGLENTYLHEAELEKWLKLSLNAGCSPKQLFENVFNTIEKEIATGEYKHVFYCGCFGGFGYSETFYSFVRTHFDKHLTPSHREVYHYIVKFAETLGSPMDIALEKASERYCKLKVKLVPKHRAYKIHEYDGFETVEILNDFS